MTHQNLLLGKYWKLFLATLTLTRTGGARSIRERYEIH